MKYDNIQIYLFTQFKKESFVSFKHMWCFLVLQIALIYAIKPNKKPLSKPDAVLRYIFSCFIYDPNEFGFSTEFPSH